MLPTQRRERSLDVTMRWVSASVVDDMIAAWRRARLSCDHGRLDYPRINILHPEHGVGEESDEIIDDTADTVQAIVDDMPEGVKTAFLAFHLGIIRNEYCRDKPHKWRSLVLGISHDVYESRERRGWGIIRE